MGRENESALPAGMEPQLRGTWCQRAVENALKAGIDRALNGREVD
jgi:hypothetical protein